ncbi:MAG: D-alanine--D-alanine ligase [Candidatus Krumholzibacteriota bacterium]
MKIAVLMGGNSPERDISLMTGKAVAEGLRRSGHEVELLDIPSVRGVLDLDVLREVDVVFPALHGGQGEDGHLQALLDILEVPYALSGPAASALAMDKSSAKRIMRAAGIPTPDWLQVTWDRRREMPRGGVCAGLEEGCTIDRVFERAAADLGFPLVIKLNGAGSSVGVEIVEEPGGFKKAFLGVTEAEPVAGATPVLDILMEKFIPGRELTAAIFLGRRLPLLEIRPNEGFYDYRNKYTLGASDYLVPAPVHSPVYEKISADALRVFELTGCRGLARVDFRLDGDDYSCLEINTIPGMTETSLVPKAAAAVGIGFEHLVEDVCLAALPAK